MNATRRTPRPTVISLLALLLIAPPALSNIASLPRTGQTIAIDGVLDAVTV